MLFLYIIFVGIYIRSTLASLASWAHPELFIKSEIFSSNYTLQFISF